MEHYGSQPQLPSKNHSEVVGTSLLPLSVLFGKQGYLDLRFLKEGVPLVVRRSITYR